MNELVRGQVKDVEIDASLDPQDWSELRALAHRMLDETIDSIANVRERPVWQPVPDHVRASFRADVPRSATGLDEVYREFSTTIAPYATGNVHPGFMGWVHGGGTAVGMLAEMLAAGLNANLGGRDHMPIEVEQQITAWMRELFGFPQGASGIFVTGTSMANLMAVLVARTSALGALARQHGLGNDGALLTAYTSKAAHGCISRAMDIAGLGTDALRKIGVDADHRMDVAALKRQIAVDREVGLKPFLVVASAGTVDIGAIDDLTELAAFCRAEESGFMSMVRSVRLRCCRRNWRQSSRASSLQIPSRSISTNGGRCPMMPASFWCATARAIGPPSRSRRPICAVKRGACRVVRTGRAISAPICRAAFAR